MQESDFLKQNQKKQTSKEVCKSKCDSFVKKNNFLRELALYVQPWTNHTVQDSWHPRESSPASPQASVIVKGPPDQNISSILFSWKLNARQVPLK